MLEGVANSLSGNAVDVVLDERIECGGNSRRDHFEIELPALPKTLGQELVA